MLHLQKTSLKVARKKDSMTKKAYKSGVKYPMQHEDCLRDLKPNYLVSDPTCSAGAAGFHWPGCRCWEYLDSVGSPSNLQNTQPYGQLLPPTCTFVLSIKQLQSPSSLSMILNYWIVLNECLLFTANIC